MVCISAKVSVGKCLKATISRVDSGLTATTNLAGERLRATIGRYGDDLSASVRLASMPMSAIIGRIGGNLNAQIGLICTPNTEAYIKVTPEVLWFFTENDILNVDVMSNIKWIVK